MFGLVYLLLAFGLGIVVVDRVFKGVEISKKISRWWVVSAGGYLVGTVLITWMVYLMGYLFRGTDKPLFWANLIVMPVIAFLIIWRGLCKKWKGIKLKQIGLREIFLLFLIMGPASFLMFDSFRIVDEKIQLGLSVFSDFGPHLAMIRSFSYGGNFPTTYFHFPDGTIRYHFLFQFLVGNLEFLGLRLDMAMNIPSILSLTCSLMLLYALAVKITGKRLVGFLVVLMFYFRSGYAFFDLFLETSSWEELWQRIINNQIPIGKTENESWGLWTINVYANQRHFGMAIGVMFLIIFVLFDLLKNNFKKGGKKFIQKILLSREAWMIEDYWRAIFVGCTLGLLTYWNAAVVIASLIIIGGIALTARAKLEFVVVLAITVFLGQLQKMFFVSGGGEVVKPELYIGFLAQQKDFFGIWQYYGKLLGIMPIIFGLGLIFGKRLIRYLGFLFLGPLIFATFIKMTPDVSVAHKYVIISIILMNIVVTCFIDVLLKSRKLIPIIISVFLILEMTVTGVVDWITFHNMNAPNRAFLFETKDETIDWIRSNTANGDVFLTEAVFMNPVLLSGRRIFYGWPYYAWSAGYETLEREGVVKKIYEGEDYQLVKQLLEENHISYVMIDDNNRFSSLITVNELWFDKNFPVVYANLEKQNLKIYKVN
jgi:hypothetical protein